MVGHVCAGGKSCLLDDAAAQRMYACDAGACRSGTKLQMFTTFNGG